VQELSAVPLRTTPTCPHKLSTWSLCPSSQGSIVFALPVDPDNVVHISNYIGRLLSKGIYNNKSVVLTQEKKTTKKKTTKNKNKKKKNTLA
jgi:hypothetical protein